MRERIHVGPSVTKATRVRIEIMRIVSKKCGSNSENLFLYLFLARPILKVVDTRSKIERVLTFVDACNKFWKKLVKKDLQKTNQIAGLTFKG